MDEGSKLEILLQQVNKSHVCFKNVESILSLDRNDRINSINDVNKVYLDIRLFSYDEEPLLQNVNINLSKGDALLIKGKNGSGKSTLLKLIVNLIEGYEGIVRINNLDVNTIKRECLSDQILYIAQEEKYLNETLYDYLRIVTKKEISDHEISEILNSLNFGSFDEKLDYNGGSLSGGQKKKLALAKLIILKNKASLILLDEVDSGLDNDTKILYTNIINEIISEKNKILIVIQHTDSDEIEYNKNYTV